MYNLKEEAVKHTIKGSVAIFAMMGLSMADFDAGCDVVLKFLAILIGLATFASYFFDAQRKRNMLKRMEIDDANRKDREMEIRAITGNPPPENES